MEIVICGKEEVSVDCDPGNPVPFKCVAEQNTLVFPKRDPIELIDGMPLSASMKEHASAIILSSPIHVGSGQVVCPHGILSVPAPTTAYILKDVPIYGGEIQGEMCTPTDAAILTRFASDFCAAPHANDAIHNRRSASYR